MSGDKGLEARFGGQAVIEGVMIKGPRHAAVAVRNDKGEMKVTTRPAAVRQGPPLSWPGIRGLVVFGQTLGLGLWALDVSAKEATGDEPGPPWMTAVTAAFAFALGAALFFWLPLFLTQLVRDNLLPFLASGPAFNLCDGLVRVMIFVLYVWVIGLIPGIRRVFEYHGAEHKIVSAWEKEGRLDTDAAGRYSTLHPRCGTAFLLTVMVVSILVFSLIPQSSAFLAKLGWRLLLLPVIAGMSYEIIRLSDRRGGRILARLLAPGLWLQKLTTREPDAGQIEVAAAAMTAVLDLEGIGHD